MGGFFAKFYVFVAVLEKEMYALAIIGLLTTVMSAFYYLKIIKTIYFDDKMIVALHVVLHQFSILSHSALLTTSTATMPPSKLIREAFDGLVHAELLSVKSSLCFPHHFKYDCVCLCVYVCACKFVCEEEEETDKSQSQGDPLWSILVRIAPDSDAILPTSREVGYAGPNYK